MSLRAAAACRHVLLACSCQSCLILRLYLLIASPTHCVLAEIRLGNFTKF
jgi:hypothetical protein